MAVDGVGGIGGIGGNLLDVGGRGRLTRFNSKATLFTQYHNPDNPAPPITRLMLGIRQRNLHPLKKISQTILFRLVGGRTVWVFPIAMRDILERFEIMVSTPPHRIPFHAEIRSAILVAVAALHQAFSATAPPQAQPAARPTPPL